MLTLLAISLLSVRGALAVGSPFGYASGTTGGAGATQTTPSLAAELQSWLEDSVTRNILLDKTYGFTDLEGSVTGAGCKPWTCSPNPQLAINANNWCSSSYETTTITYKKAGTSGIRVGSNKTILGKGTSGWITYSTGCDQHHYWVFLFAGNGDQLQITLARNYVYYTAGRGPHIGGTSGYTQTLHMYNNYFNDITGHALDPATGSRVLMEGNYFNAVKTPSTGDTAGTVFAPTSSTMDAQCSSTLGRNCVSNTLTGGSGTLPNAASTAAISVFTAPVVKSASVMDPTSVPAYVLVNTELGIVN